MPPKPELDLDRLQEIMEELPDSAEYNGPERREYSLTKGDVLLIYKIARIAVTPHVCPFKGEEAGTLKTVASSINKTQKIASVALITGLVGGMLSGIWLIVLHFMKEFINIKVK